MWNRIVCPIVLNLCCENNNKSVTLLEKCLAGQLFKDQIVRSIAEVENREPCRIWGEACNEDSGNMKKPHMGYAIY